MATNYNLVAQYLEAASHDLSLDITTNPDFYATVEKREAALEATRLIDELAAEIKEH